MALVDRDNEHHLRHDSVCEMSRAAPEGTLGSLEKASGVILWEGEVLLTPPVSSCVCESGTAILSPGSAPPLGS